MRGAGLATLLALVARQEHPWGQCIAQRKTADGQPPPIPTSELRKQLTDADKQVGKLEVDDGLEEVDELLRRAWQVRQQSAGRRAALKRAWVGLSSMLLAAQFLLALISPRL